MSNLFKMSFIGDIMCEKPIMKASYKNGRYNFDYLFINIKDKLDESDVVVANLETIFAGKDKGYTKDIYSFNTPDEFVEAISKVKIDYVSTANNHCLDRGIDGLKRTIEVLDKYNVRSYGTYAKREDRRPYETVDLGGFKVALISYTYGTNVDDNKVILDENNHYHVNVLRSQKVDFNNFNKTLKADSFRGKLSKVIRSFTTLEQRMKLKKSLGKLTLKKSNEPFKEEDLYKPYIDKLLEDIKAAKENTNYVIVNLHSGALFNPEVGAYTEKIVEIIKKAGVDAIIAHHPHIVKHTEHLGDMFVAYSLGNFSISPSSIYVIPDDLPEYGVMLHLYFTDNKIVKMTFTIFKMVESENGNLTVYPIDKLYGNLNDIEKEKLLKDSIHIYNVFTGTYKNSLEVLSEYELTN